MPQINFIGPSYHLRSSNVDSQRTINMYPDINEIGNGKVQYFFTGTPGLKNIIDTQSKVRAMFVDSRGDLYTVEGQEFCKYDYDDVDENGVLYLRRVVKGGIYTTDTDVSIAENGFQICVVDGEHLYIYIYADDTFQEYTPEGFLGSNVVSYYDTYFVFVKPESQIYYISSIYDGTILDANKYQLKENYPDNIVTCVSFNNYLWLLGEKTLQILYNSGDVFPLSNMSGGTANIGCIARKSVAICSNSLFWIGKDENGFGTVYMTQGNNNPSKISNFAVDYFLQSQEDLSNATAYAYQEDGHNFYVVNFPNAQTTWAYDFATQMWHERQSLKLGSDMTRHIAENHVVWRNKHLVSDYKENKIYEMSLDFYDDDSNPIRRYRRSPNFAGTELERQSFNEFQLDMELGNPDFKDAKIYLRYSNDCGKTWSDYLQKSCGSTGDYRHRLIWRRLGTSRDRTWEISITDPIKFTLLNAYVR